LGKPSGAGKGALFSVEKRKLVALSKFLTKNWHFFFKNMP
jgi:hypothetical protein